jgi:PAS domain S-box-containing protein
MGDTVPPCAGADEPLRRSEAHLRALLTQNVGGIAEASLDGSFTFVNDRYSEIVGFTRDELLSGMTWQSLLHPEDWDEISERLDLLVATGEPFQVEKRYVRRDGSCVWVTNSVSCIRDADGSAASLILLTVDIEERKQAEERLENAYADLEQRVQDRTAALSNANAALQEQVAERLSIESDRDEWMRRLLVAQERERRRIARELHDDFAQRLAALQMQVEMHSQDSAETPILRRLSQQIEGLSRDLRDLSHRLHPSILEDLGLEAALKALVDTMEDSHALSVHLDIRNLPRNVPLPISTALYHIAQEALRNIVKHTHPGGAVSVKLFAQAGTAQLSVRDTGPGFDLQPLRSHNAIGLASMHERARLLGGDLTLQTAPGRGTTVTAVVPLAAPGPIGVPRVVVCDDGPRIRSHLLELLAPACRVVGEARYGAQAIEAARRLRPDIMVLDISLPGMGGLEMMRLLHQRLPQIRIIFVTERRDRSYVDQAFALGAQGYVIKSLAAKELAMAVREVAAGGLFRRLPEDRT